MKRSVEERNWLEQRNVIVCRCEDVTLEEIRRAIAQGATTLDELKRLLRVGMGPCQGRTCRELLARELAEHLGKPVAEIMPPTFRPPAKPVKLGLLSRMVENAPRGDEGSSLEGGESR
ncbi:MAG: (2Fe-2S)-binding protein [Firmicutes bacterium]|nr:(2Fe-2S)-binding protein [Candidatus Fermentithermobacillaceae bacterium]